MKLPEFSNALRILHSIDEPEFAQAAAGCEPGSSLRLPEAAVRFYAEPVRFFLKADDQSQAALWRIIEVRMRPKDRRIVYGANCTWWDSIDKVGKIDTGPSSVDPSITIKLPCCPHCKGVLFEVPNEAAWFAGVDKYEQKTPGYRAMIEWARGRCFYDFGALKAAYEARGST